MKYVVEIEISDKGWTLMGEVEGEKFAYSQQLHGSIAQFIASSSGDYEAAPSVIFEELENLIDSDLLMDLAIVLREMKEEEEGAQ